MERPIVPLADPEEGAPLARSAVLWKSRELVEGCELFNHGFYWEAHEVWERVWLRLGRSGREAEIVKALIKFAAAGVKRLEGRPHGVVRHAARARDLLQGVIDASGTETPAGELRTIEQWLSLCDQLPTAEFIVDAPTGNQVFPFVLIPA